LPIGELEEAPWVFLGRMCRHDLEEQGSVEAGTPQLITDAVLLDEALAWQHVVDEVPDSVGQLNGDQAAAQACQQVQRAWPTDLVVRRVVAEAEMCVVQIFDRLADEVGGWPRKHVLQRQADTCLGQHGCELLARPQQLLQAHRKLSLGKIERASVHNDYRHVERGSRGHRGSERRQRTRPASPWPVDRVDPEAMRLREPAKAPLPSRREILRMANVGTERKVREASLGDQRDLLLDG